MARAKQRKFTKGELVMIGRAIKGRAADSELEVLAKVGAAVNLDRLGWRVTTPARDQYFASTKDKP